MTFCIIGVDPGPTTGVSCWWLEKMEGLKDPAGTWITMDPWVFQCNAPAVYGLVSHLLEMNEGPAKIVLAGEAFADGRGPGARGEKAKITRSLITDLDQLAEGWHWRNAGTVKPWATDRRLHAAGMYDLTAGMPHARDACRHALFAACHDCDYPDPLSRKKA